MAAKMSYLSHPGNVGTRELMTDVAGQQSACRCKAAASHGPHGSEAQSICVLLGQKVCSHCCKFICDHETFSSWKNFWLKE